MDFIVQSQGTKSSRYENNLNKKSDMCKRLFRMTTDLVADLMKTRVCLPFHKRVSSIHKTSNQLRDQL